MRIIAFVGSPVDVDEKDLVKLAKKLKKEKARFRKCSQSLNGGGILNSVRTIGGGSAHCVHNAYSGRRGQKRPKKCVLN